MDIIVAKQNELPNPKSNIFYGMIILIELADVFYKNGCSLTVLSEKYGFTPSMLHPVVDRLENVGVIARHNHDEDWIYLKEEPKDYWILDVVPLLRESLREK